LLPDKVGLQFGAADEGFNSMRLEIHYNNPGHKSGVIDNGGVVFYYTTKIRPIQASITQIGDPFVSLTGQPVGNGLQEHSFECPSGCSQAALQSEVTVLSTSLHMHKSGVRAYNEQIRDGRVIRKTEVEFFDFMQQGNQVVQTASFTIKPGDSFRTVCEYNSTNGTVFGPSSDNEMCITFMLYYPRQTIGDRFAWVCARGYPWEVCAANHTSRSIATDMDLDRTFGSTQASRDGAQCQAPVVNGTGEDDDSGDSSATTSVLPDEQQNPPVDTPPSVDSTSDAILNVFSFCLFGRFNCGVFVSFLVACVSARF
jgi:Copper type II ascorbate-dependent monooxygenase, C-terminal domain